MTGVYAWGGGESDGIQKLIIAKRMILPQNVFQRTRKTGLPIRITTNFVNIHKMFYHQTISSAHIHLTFQGRNDRKSVPG